MEIPEVKRHICYGEYQQTLRKASKTLKPAEYKEFEGQYNIAVDQAINPIEYDYQDVANVLEEYEQRLFKDYVNSDYENHFALFRIHQIENLLSMLQEEFCIERHRRINARHGWFNGSLEVDLVND